MKTKSPLKDITLIQLFDRFDTDEKARQHLEKVLWPHGPVCPHCKNHKEKPIYKLEPRTGSKAAVRDGVYKCGACLQQFSVTIGTIFEDSHIPLRKWLIAWYLMCSSKRGISSLQLKRILEIGSYSSALFMSHRIRHALKSTGYAEKLSGIIEADEVVIGGAYPQAKGGKLTNKVQVMALVQRGGPVRSQAIKSVSGGNLKQIIRENVLLCSEVHTDQHRAYAGLGPKYTHKTVNHSRDEFHRREGNSLISTCAVENYFANLKRGIVGVYGHISEQHLPLYLAEFEHRYNCRKISDGERMDLGLTKAAGKRLMLKTPTA